MLVMSGHFCWLSGVEAPQSMREQVQNCSVADMCIHALFLVPGGFLFFCIEPFISSGGQVTPPLKGSNWAKHGPGPLLLTELISC